MAEKQLIVVVEGTAALGPYWQTILSDYLEKIIRCFYGNELTGQKFSGETPELAMVVFCAHGPCSDFLVQRSGWTKDLDVFFRWLSGISFSGGGFSDVAIAEGLSEALLMFPITTNGSQPLQNFDTQKHCILIAASNPHSVPTPVYRPLIPSLEHNEKVEAQPETCLADAEAVAKSLGQCSVSLSVISPKPLLKLRGIYNAGKRISRAADPVVDHSKNPHFLVLISENFMEARAALSHPLAGNMTSNQNNIKVDVTSSGNLIPGSTSASISTVNGSVNRQAVSMGNIPTATVKVEPTILPSLGSGPAFSHMPPISMVPAQGVPSLQTSSPSPTSQEMNATSEGVQEMKPSVNTLSHSLRPTVPAAANVNILNHLSQHRQMISSASIAGASSIGLQTMAGTPMTMHMPNMISNGLSSSAVSGITSVSGSTMIMGNAHVAQNGTLSSFTSATPSLSGNSNNGIPPAMANLQSNISMGQSVPVMTQGSLASGAQIAQGGIGMNQNIMNSIGPGSISSGPGSMMPMPGMSQQAGLNSLGMSNNSTMNMPLTQHGPGFQQNQSKYVKIWEGALSGQRQGLPVFICKLEGYRSTTASETIAADWPQSMQIVRLIAQDHMNNKQYVGKADYLVFRTLNPHGFLGQLQEKKLCAVIQLPSQTLLLSVSDKAGRLIGMLFPGDMVVFKPQATSQQQQQMGMNQQQQHMGMSQQPQQMVGPGMGMSQQQQPQQMVGPGMGMSQQQQQQPQQMVGPGMVGPGMGMSQQQQQQPQQMVGPGMVGPGMGMSQQQQQQPQQMVGPGMGMGQQQMSQTYVQGPGRSQLMSQGKMSSHGPSAGFLPDGHH